jgi:hypothetical protein
MKQRWRTKIESRYKMTEGEQRFPSRLFFEGTRHVTVVIPPKPASSITTFRIGLQCCDGEKDILACLYPPRTDRGFSAPIVVGFRRNHPDFIHRMVDCLSQRVVLEVALSTLEIRVRLSGGWRETR